MTTPKYTVMELSSPYGEGTIGKTENVKVWKFSPPYGDCTDMVAGAFK